MSCSTRVSRHRMCLDKSFMPAKHGLRRGTNNDHEGHRRGSTGEPGQESRDSSICPKTSGLHQGRIVSSATSYDATARSCCSSVCQFSSLYMRQKHAISRWWQNAPARTHACQSRRVSSFRAIDDLFVRPGLDPVVLLLEHSLVTSATPSVMLMFHAARRGTGLRRPIPPECCLHQSL